MTGRCPPEREEPTKQAREQDTRFTLEQYNKAISCLRPYFLKTDHNDESTRVVLITCMVFVCLELLQGRYDEGQTHLQSGLYLLSQLQAKQCPVGTEGVLVLGNLQESYNDCYLVEIYSRLYAQSAFYGQPPWPFCKPAAIASVNPGAAIQPPPPLSGSLNQARQYLDGIFNAIHCLTARCPKKQIVQVAPKTLLDTQSRIQTCLGLWHQAYKASRPNLISQLNTRDALSYPLLTVYHAMAFVMVATCLASPDEAIFDSFEVTFAFLVSTCEEMLMTAAPLVVADTAAGHCSEIFSFTADIGLIPPLYYSALKCRVPSLRRRAINLLETATHRESFWNGTIAAKIAREVAMIEEQGLGSDASYIDMDPGSTYHNTDDAQSSGLKVPEWHRVHGIVLTLPGGLSREATVACKRRGRDGEWESLEKTFTV